MESYVFLYPLRSSSMQFGQYVRGKYSRPHKIAGLYSKGWERVMQLAVFITNPPFLLHAQYDGSYDGLLTVRVQWSAPLKYRKLHPAFLAPVQFLHRGSTPKL
jgi:hypothetical protein